MCRKRFSLFLIAGAVVFSQSLIAQTIELPEVTTVISGENEAAGSDALPDFDDVLKLPKGSGEIQPVLPGNDAADGTETVVSAQPEPEKSVYAEGLIGGGYPMLFTGNISVFRSVGESPFKFVFDHDSAIGYSNHSVTDNYFDRTTKLEINKAYNCPPDP